MAGGAQSRADTGQRSGEIRAVVTHHLVGIGRVPLQVAVARDDQVVVSGRTKCCKCAISGWPCHSSKPLSCPPMRWPRPPANSRIEQGRGEESSGMWVPLRQVNRGL